MDERDVSSTEDLVYGIMNESRSKDAVSSVLLKKLVKVYNETEFDDFFKSFLNCLKICLVQKENSECLHNAITLISKFLVFVSSSEEQENNCKVMKTSDCFQNVISFLEECCHSRNMITRKRVCTFLEKVLDIAADNATVDDDLHTRMRKILLDSAKDKVPAVRVEAINALYRLQDPSDSNCPVIKEYCYHLECDPSSEVRQAVLYKIGICNSKILDAIIERTMDISEKVRKDVYTIVSKIPVLKLRISQRIHLISVGLKDSHKPVQESVKKNLLPAWFNHLKKNFLLFLEALDVCMNPVDVSASALKVLIESKPFDAVVDQLESLLDGENLMKDSYLCAESCLFWRCVFEHFIKDNELTDETEHIRAMLPELTAYCNCIRNYYLQEESNKELKQWEVVEREFILCQLLQLCKLLDFQDEVGKNNLSVLLFDLLAYPKMELDTLRYIIELCFMITNDTNSNFMKITNCINELRFPVSSDQDMDAEVESANVPMEGFVTLKCLRILQEVMHLGCVKELSPAMRTLYEELVMPACSLQDPNIASAALEVMGAFCLRDESLAKKEFIRFCVEISNEDLCVSALKVVFDLLVFYGPAAFRLKDLNGTQGQDHSFCSEDDENKEAVTGSIASMLVDLLDDSFDPIRITAVNGITRLMLTGTITSSKLLSRLIVTWLHPDSRNCIEIQQYLGFFFPFYAKNFPGAQSLFVDAFLPTMRAVFNAPLHNDLNKVDPNSVAKLLLSVTSKELVQDEYADCHSNLALMICNEMLDSSEFTVHLILSRTLVHLDLSSVEDFSSLSPVYQLCRQLKPKLNRYRDKMPFKNMQTFMNTLEVLRGEEGISKITLEDNVDEDMQSVADEDMQGVADEDMQGVADEDDFSNGPTYSIS